MIKFYKMDESCSENDVSLSPSQILERLKVLRHLQLLQRGKLQKQRLQYHEASDNTEEYTEIVSQFSNSTGYNSFLSVLQTSHDISQESKSLHNDSNGSLKVTDKDLVDGVAILNISQESEFVINTSVSNKSKASNTSKRSKSPTKTINRNVDNIPVNKKQISLDDMPILSPKQDFETLLLEKLKDEKPPKVKSPKKDRPLSVSNKKPFLRRGEGMARFGIKKNDLVIQNTKELPWKRKNFINNIQSPVKKILPKKTQPKKKVDIQITVAKPNEQNTNRNVAKKLSVDKAKKNTQIQPEVLIDTSNCEIHGPKKPSPLKNPSPKINLPKGKTWATVFTKEQEDFLKKLKQSEYYKNFASPAKSTITDVSCDENIRQQREVAEQNMFDLIENKVSNDSFSIDSSFFNKFLQKNNMEVSGESTPLIMQKCLENNPALMHIYPELRGTEKKNEISSSENESCDCTECCSDSCSTVSCCSAETCTKNNKYSNKSTIVQQQKVQINQRQKTNSKKFDKPSKDECQSNKCHNDTVTDEHRENEKMKANMAEMNAKLVATSELLKERLRELENEIETFRTENTSLTKLREEVDLERQKFYEEKSAFEQKFNEEKILSEYYLAEEKEKLSKQKQLYEKYVREMRGRLNKKEKDEVINLKKEIHDLKEEIRVKDAKSTCTIARLRNQLKIMEKEKNDLKEEVEKLKKENRRIQHSNEITRRLTNVKYLEEINKKLNNLSSKDTRSHVSLDSDIKYKALEIERQSRSRKVKPVTKGPRPRAKSVPNLNVTSRYAKYFSQRDANSELEKYKITREGMNIYDNDELDDNEDISDNNSLINYDHSSDDDKETENNLEKIYQETFRVASPMSDMSSLSNVETNKQVTAEIHNAARTPDPFFIRKTNVPNRDTKSPVITTSITQLSNSNSNSSKSPISILSNKSGGRKSPSNCSKASSGDHARSKSPTVRSNFSSNSKLATIIHQDQILNVSPEPSTTMTKISKTNLNPSEIRKPDGSKELRFPNGNVKFISSDGKYSKFVYYNGDVKENFYDEGRIKYFYAESKTYHTTHPDGLEVLEFPDGQVEKRYKDGSSEIRLPNGSIRYHDPKNEHVREEWRFPDGTALTVSATGERRVVFPNGQVEVHAKDHKRREFPDGTVKIVYNDGTSETRYASGRIRIKDKHGNLIMDSAPG